VISCGPASSSRMFVIRAVFAEQIKFVLYLVKTENYKASIYVIFSIVLFPPNTYVQIF
jgi:hypothetical protein